MKKEISEFYIHPSLEFINNLFAYLFVGMQMLCMPDFQEELLRQYRKYGKATGEFETSLDDIKITYDNEEIYKNFNRIIYETTDEKPRPRFTPKHD